MTDSMKVLNIKYSLRGLCAECGEFLTERQLSRGELWARFVDQFRVRSDGDNSGWRGEYWGKMMRGGVLVYQFTQDPALCETLTETVRDMLSVAEDDGRVSSFSRETEFRAWDLWCRKYVLLGLEYYLEICEDEALRAQIIAFLCRAADCILARIGLGEGQIHITRATNYWLGLNSSSILEPMVRLYGLTGEQKYFDFAEYIVNSGFTDGLNIIDRAYENILKPYQYGVAKAYEMMSCFEGLLEFYRITGIEKYRTAVVNFAHAVIESEISVIGSCGCTHELFDHTKTRQTQRYEGIMQETCVTVTWMKFCSQLLRLTGESVFADEIEHSFYNAYLGSMNTQDKDCDEMLKKIPKHGLLRTPMTVDSYSPLIPGKRGVKTGGFQILSDNSYYGCCVCIGAAGAGIFARHAVMESGGDTVINFYEKSSYELSGGTLIEIDTDYPADGRILIKINCAKETTLKLRIPAWSRKTIIAGSESSAKGYASVALKAGEQIISLELDMSIRETLPEKWDTDVLYIGTVANIRPPIVVKHRPEDDKYISLARGPLTLAADSRLGKSAHDTYSFKRSDGAIEYSLCKDTSFAEGERATLKCRFTSEDGNDFCLIDYASAGKDWESDIAAWLPTK